MSLKKISTAVCLSILASIFAGQAYAETWNPNGEGYMDSMGSLAVGKGGIQLNCSLESVLTISENDATVDDFRVFGNILCFLGGVRFLNTPYQVDGLEGNIVSISGVTITAVLGGDCAGTISGPYDPVLGVLTVVGAVLPGVGEAADCTLSGDFLLGITQPGPEAAPQYTIP